MTNPRVTIWSFFVDDFPVGIDLVLVDFFWVNSGCEWWWIHASPLEFVSLTNSESKGAVCSHESRRHIPKVFRWCFLSRHRLRFGSPFLSHQGCKRFRIHTSPLEAVSGMIYEAATTQFSLTFLSHRGCGRWRIHASPLGVVSLTFF